MHPLPVLPALSWVGIDIGLSDKRPTTGICVIAGERLVLRRCRATETVGALAGLVAPPYVAAIDGPLLPDFEFRPCLRAAESILSSGVFQKRCKPGATASPTGRDLHRQATDIAGALDAVAVYEAFPNAFLGVLCTSFPQTERAKKSDAFWEQSLGNGALAALVRDWFSPALADRLPGISGHEERAAFVCALTARGAHAGRTTAVGDQRTGFIHLPPEERMADWARAELG